MEYTPVLLLGVLLAVLAFCSRHVTVAAVIQPPTSTGVGVADPEPGVSYHDDTVTNTTGANTGGLHTLEPTVQPEGTQTVGPTPEPEHDKNLNGSNETGKSEPKGGEGEPEDNLGAKNETGKAEPEDSDGEPDDKPEPESEDDGGAEPEDGGAEPEAESSFAEPGPNWEEAKDEWQAAWELHVYMFGGLFVILGLYCVVSVARLWKMNNLLSRNYFLSLNILNITVCILRAVYLFIDAYNSRKVFPAILDYFLYSTVFPCLTALFSVLFYALLLATRVRIMSQKVQRLHVLIAIISFHFLLSFITDVVVGVSSRAAVLVFICQLFYVIWGLFMFIGYLVIFKRMYQGVLKRHTYSEKKKQARYASVKGAHEKITKRKHSLGLAVKVTLASALFGLACVGFQLFGMFGVYGVIGDYRTPNPWSWWAYQSGLRLLEFLMCFSIAVVSVQPLKLSQRNRKHRALLLLVPCCQPCCGIKADDMDTSSSLEPSGMSDTNGLKN